MKQSSQDSRRGFLKQAFPGGIVLAASPVMVSGSLNVQTSITPLINKPVPRLPCSILMASELDEKFEKHLLGLSPQIELRKDLDNLDYKAALKTADIHFGQISAENFALTENLSWVQSVSAGVEHQLYPNF
jgi:hypothetical protein